jgi:hypothetical protein
MASLGKNVGIKAARIAGGDRAMDAMASRVESLVIGAAANHRDSGTFIHSIQTQRVTGPRGVEDRRVFSDDPAALAKEFGHTTPAGTWVPGIHAFGQALGQAKRG